VHHSVAPPVPRRTELQGELATYVSGQVTYKKHVMKHVFGMTFMTRNMSYNMFRNLPGIGFSLEDAAPATAGAAAAGTCVIGI